MKIRTLGAITVAMVIAGGACSGCGSSGSGKAASTTAGGPSISCTNGTGPWAWCGDAKTGYIALNQPDNNPGNNGGSGSKFLIGILSPGDTHDHGYYQSFVDEAQRFADAHGGTVTTIDKVPPASAAQDARNLCRRKPDMIAIAASTLKDAIPVASEAVCKNTLWYVAGGEGVVQTKYFAQTNDIPSQSGYASGVAAGLLMKSKNITKAGFITGFQATFTTNFEKAWETGIKSQVPDAKVVATYTGDFDKSDLAVEAYSAMKAQGVGIVYPYLGGATDAVALQAAKDHVLTLTPGTDRCSSTNPPFAISVVFSPGDYFAGALERFGAGTLHVGTALTFHMGVDPVPTVKICLSARPTAGEAKVLAQTIADVGTGKVDTGTITGLDDYNGYVPKS